MDPNTRPMPPLNADERTTLEAWLDVHRTTPAGLDDTQAAQQAELAVLRHPGERPRMTGITLDTKSAEAARSAHGPRCPDRHPGRA